MHGIDVETTALTPDEGKLRLVPLSDGSRALVFDAFRQQPELIRDAIAAHDELVAHNATFERAWLDAALSYGAGLHARHTSRRCEEEAA